jgi:tetratricopeptide (TPR) repeat protein
MTYLKFFDTFPQFYTKIIQLPLTLRGVNMKIAEQIDQLFKIPVDNNMREIISNIGIGVLKAEIDEILIPDILWEIIGLDSEKETYNDNSVCEKEHVYFKKCFKAFALFKNSELNKAEKILMEAKWDFNDWSLAHYLLGLVLFEMRKFKASYAEFLKANDFEPFDHKPMAVMREITYSVLKNIRK